MSKRLFRVYFVVERYGDHLDLHVLTNTFPTRRASDRYDLEQASQYGCSQEILQPMAMRQSSSDQCYRSRSAGDHCGTPAGESNDDPDDKRGKQAHFRIDACNE